MMQSRTVATIAGALFVATTTTASAGAAPSFPGATCSAAASLFAPSSYYNIELVPTKRVPGTGGAKGTARVHFARSPFGVAVSTNGSYVYDVTLVLERIKPKKNGFYTAWVTSSDLKEVNRLGVLDDSFKATGRVDWNKFLVVVTLEPSEEPTGMWKGLVVMRGMARSGMMHTLAGHGPFEQEPCSKYGY